MPVRWSLHIVVLLLMASSAACGGAAAPEDVSALVAATDEVFAAFDDFTPGCAVGVHRDGQTRLATGYGAADLDADVPITADTVFDIASVSKQITAGVVMALVVDGDLALDGDVTRWLPHLDVTPGTVTIDDLVHHTSGLPDYIDLLDAEYADVTTAEDALAVLEDVDAQDPGTVFEYSNTNYFLLGQVVEAAAGTSLVDVAEERIFDPLGMADTRIRDDQGTFDPGQAVGYADEGDGWEPLVGAWRQTGDGAVHTSVGDLLRWARLFLDPPREAGVGSREWLDLMLTPGDAADDDGSSYGGGISLYEIDGEPVLFHGGSWVGVSSYLQVQPADDLAVAVTCNIDDLDAEALGDVSEPEPDIAVVAPTGPDAHPTTAVAVVEVSQSTQALDLGEKARRYAAAGIPVYWVMDLPGGRVVIHTDASSQGYTTTEVHTGGTTELLGVTVHLDALLP